jgi:hypothetical protein
MNVKEVVKIALEYVADIFASGGIENLALEEVVYDPEADVWDVTVGFARPWDVPKQPIIAPLYDPQPRRVYKVVRVDAKSKEVLSVKLREVRERGSL